jgi:hypothetical protein
MTTPTAPGRRRRFQLPRGFAAVGLEARTQLCFVAEEFEVQACHVAALVAFTATVSCDAAGMRIRCAHGPTAWWLTETLSEHGAELIEVDGSGGTALVRDPHIVLQRYGFDAGRWIFGRSQAATLGIGRGAVHAAVGFNRRGMQVICPNAPMMLTLTAVLARLQIPARPSETRSQVSVAAVDVTGALTRLGIEQVGAQYRRVVESRG